MTTAVKNFTIRNRSNTVVVYSQPGERGRSIEWGAAGSPEDVQQVGEDLMSNPHFLRAIAFGTLEVTDESALSDSIRRQIEAQQVKAKDEKDALASMIERSDGREIVIGADDFESHLERVAKMQPSDPVGNLPTGAPTPGGATS